MAKLTLQPTTQHLPIYHFNFFNEGKIYERAQQTNNNRMVIREQIPATTFSFSFSGDPSSRIVCVCIHALEIVQTCVSSLEQSWVMFPTGAVTRAPPFSLGISSIPALNLGALHTAPSIATRYTKHRTSKRLLRGSSWVRPASDLSSSDWDKEWIPNATYSHTSHTALLHFKTLFK